jgi:class 3 adenylate cyclase/Tfp pilus assembly protein PilF
MNRRLAAILVADVVGYSRLMADDEAGTLSALRERRKSIIEPLVREYSGRIVKFTGDGVLVEFASAVKALDCALEIQSRMAAANAGAGHAQPVLLRIGVNLGEVVNEGADIFGDGVNIAARLEALAQPGGICVSAKIQDEVAGKVSCAFADIGEQMLKNMSRPVRAYRVTAPPAGAARVQARVPSSRKPVVAVLPLDNLMGSGEQHLIDGLTEDIITELSRFRNLDVLSRHASFQLSKTPAGSLEAARSAGCTYLVEGSVRRIGDQFRVTVQLIEISGGAHVWADRFDISSQGISEAGDELVATIASSLDSRIYSSILASTRTKPREEWTAYDCFVRGKELCNYQNEPLAIPFFEQALELDPNLSASHAWLALALALSFHFDAQRSTLERAAAVGSRALELDDADFLSHWGNALVCLWQCDYERSKSHFDRAVQLNPSKRQIKADLANWYRFTGEFDTALRTIEDVLRRDQFPARWYTVIHGHILYDLKRYEDAIVALNKSGYRNYPSHLQSVAAHFRLGNHSAARALLDELLQLKPDMTLGSVAAVTPYSEPAMLAHLLNPLRELGVSE